MCDEHIDDVLLHTHTHKHTVAAKKMVMFPFRSVPSRRKRNGRSVHKNGSRTGRRMATGKRPNVQLTIPIVASTKKMPGESKKAKRSIVLSKRSHLEAISQSSLDRRTRPESKNGSRALPQKTLEDDGSIKL